MVYLLISKPAGRAVKAWSLPVSVQIGAVRLVRLGVYALPIFTSERLYVGAREATIISRAAQVLSGPSRLLYSPLREHIENPIPR